MTEVLTEDERELLDRMITYIKYHDIKFLMQLVMKAIESAGDKNG